MSDLKDQIFFSIILSTIILNFLKISNASNFLLRKYTQHHGSQRRKPLVLKRTSATRLNERFYNEEVGEVLEANAWYASL
jgi:hypothetical protein